MPTSACAHIGQFNPARAPTWRQPHSGECGDGRQEPVRDERPCRQLEVGGSARMLFHGFVMNIGTPVSIRAPAAITERMTPALVKRFRNEIGLPIPQPS